MNSPMKFFIVRCILESSVTPKLKYLMLMIGTFIVTVNYSFVRCLFIIIIIVIDL